MLPDALHPFVRDWFCTTYSAPTPVQAALWPRIAQGEHVLAIAPTGSGKTLSAFLVALSRFADGSWPADRLSVLYISPLKALNEDIRRNLLEPLSGIEKAFAESGAVFPSIRVETRSGDTPQAARRRFLSHPPSILATTPESLAILLLNPRGRAALASVRCVVLDEVHAVLGSKRGAFLACQLGRLALVAGEFQRIALSATLRSPDVAAAFVGGFRLVRVPGGPHRYEARAVAVVAPASAKRIELAVEFPSSAVALPLPGGSGKTADEGRQTSARYEAMVERMGDSIHRNRSTLVFTDSRRRAERIAFLLNERFGAGTAFAHHGSLSKEVRRSVETRLVSGELPCVVATGSLELGIDVGSVDEVILAGTPAASSVALQRLGRSGHGVGLSSRGLLLPFHPLELLSSAALSRAVADREIESVVPVELPLDILAQTLLALILEKPASPDDLFTVVLSFFPFHALSRTAFDLVIQMLTGRYADSRLRELKSRAILDPVSGLLSPAPGALFLLYGSGGSIADRGCYSLRLSDGSKIGELDEEFVWERRPGDAFSFGTRSWKILSIGSEAVEVVPLDHAADFMPFWRAENRYRSPLLSDRILRLLDAVNAGCDLAGIPGLDALSPDSRLVLGRLLDEQRRIQNGAHLPGLSSIAAEILCDPSSARGELISVVLHTMRGRAVNEPLSMALSEELGERLSLSRIELIPDEDAVLILLPRLEGVDPATLVRDSLHSLGDPARRRTLLHTRLEASGAFGAAFREAAEHSLLLPKAGFGKRTPLWITRLRAKRLFDAVSGYGDFPAIAEAWRTCLVDQFDIPGFDALCEGLLSGAISLGFFHTRMPSPFARELAWKETNQFLYEGDDRPGHRGSSLSDLVIEEALGDQGRRPRLALTLVADFSSRLKRELPDWAPEDELSLLDWVEERVAIPLDEWDRLCAVLPDQLRTAIAGDPSLGSRLWRRDDSAGALPLILHVSRRADWEALPLSLLGEWLRTQGPVTLDRIASVFGARAAEVEDAIEALVDSGTAVRDVAVEGGDGFIVDRENLELLLRLSRKKARLEVEESPLAVLAPFLAQRQGVIGGERDAPWRVLSGLVAPARLWETDFFSCRCPGYRPALLDAELAAGRLVWFGSGGKRIGFSAPEDLELFLDPSVAASPFAQSDRARDFWELRDDSGLGNGAAIEAVWKEAWEGRLSADSFEPVRHGLRDGFAPPPLEAEGAEALSGPPSNPFGRPRRLPRALAGRWKSGVPLSGRWFPLNSEADGADSAEDALSREQLDRDRVRLLLSRWGVLARALLERELPALSWSALLATMRRMELAGELVAGRFFSGLPGLQFASPRIADELLAAEACPAIWWINACDPASLAGLSLEGLDGAFPSRLSSTLLCFRGRALAVVALRNGKELQIHVEAGDPDGKRLLSFLRESRYRAVFPESKVVVETIDGASATSSPWTPVLRELGFESDRGKLVLW